MPKRKMLMVLGGTRVGDTLHTIPFLKNACKDYRIHWVHGSYGKQAAQFIRDGVEGMDIVLEQKTDVKLPDGLKDTMNFATQNSDVFDYTGYDTIMPSIDSRKTGYPELVCHVTLNKEFSVCGVNFHRLKDSIVKLKDDPPQGEHIVVQPVTCSVWKNIPSFYDLPSQIFGDRTVYNVGLSNERTIKGPNVQITNGAHLTEVARLVRSARLVIAVHSSIACLAYYMGAPLICVAFGGGFYPFHESRPNNRTLVKPSKQELFAAINDYLANPRKRMEPEDLL